MVFEIRRREFVCVAASAAAFGATAARSEGKAGSGAYPVSVPTCQNMFVAQANASSWLTGVIVGELIGAEHGIGRMIIEAEARGEAAGMMVAVFVLMIAGVILSTLVRHLQAYLLRWRPAQQLTGWTKRPSPFKRGGGAVIRDGGVRATVSVGPMTPPSA